MTRYRYRSLSGWFTDCPALLYGISSLIGSSSALFNSSIFSILLFPLFLLPILIRSISTPPERLRAALALSLGISVYLFTSQHYTIPQFQEEAIQGTADVTFNSVSHSKTSFGAVWSYKGVLHVFTTEKENKKSVTAKNIPVRLTLPAKEGVLRPRTDVRYCLIANLKEGNFGNYTLSPRKKEWWEPTKSTFSPGEWRQRGKEYVREHIGCGINNKRAAAFLGGIATGEFDDRLLSFEFGRFGLQHIMAISGLHFAILASILGAFFRLIFPQRLSYLLLITTLSAYFLFLGPTPSVIRAFVSIMVALIGIILGKRSVALNSLGLALLITALWDPFAVLTIGFQFSFAVSAAILIWSSPCELILQRLFRKRQVDEAAGMGPLSQHGICLLAFFRQALALGMAVNIVALPMTLYHFHKFPLMGLLYNLFFPFLISISILLLVTAMMFSIPLSFVVNNLISNQLHSLNEAFTRFTLNIAFALPKSFDIAIRVHEISSLWISIYLIVIFTIGLMLKSNQEKKSASDSDIIFS